MTGWRTSSYSIANGDCVEAASGVLVRDSKNPDGPVLRFSPAAWLAFTAALKQEVTHLCPPGDTCFTPCCGLTPFELPRTDRMTVDPDAVTCGGLPGR